MSAIAVVYSLLRDLEVILIEQYECDSDVRFFLDKFIQDAFESLELRDVSDSEFDCIDCDNSGICSEVSTNADVEIILKVKCHCVTTYLHDTYAEEA